MQPSIKNIKYSSGDRAYLTLSDGSKLTTFINSITNFALAPGVQLTDTLLIELQAHDDLLAARKKAYNLLSRRPHGRVELEKKLMNGNKTARHIVQQVIGEMAEMGYLDDKQFCRLFIEDSFRLKPADGPAKIKQKLLSKGLSAAMIDNVLQDMARDHDTEIDHLRELAVRKWLSYSGNLTLQKKKEKLYRFLAGRGFPSRVSMEVIRQILQNNGDLQL